MLPRRRKGNIRYNRRYENREINDDIPASLKRRPTAYTQLSPEARREDEKKARQAQKLLCPKCGADVKKSQKYCPACGKVLKED